ncbi:hypothetical protein AB0G04_23725 [Actinoplanes sp. NPDC023801]|uniref:hypothetical protein n=1 Tax=Actinoplanes sp. NPDC023801 TaxID=3154595 RepID=UPI0033CF4A37
MRVAPAWVGAAARAEPDSHFLPVRDAIWIWSVRRYARLALWALPAAAVLYGWLTLGAQGLPGPLVVGLLAGWLALIALIALAGLLAGSRSRGCALAGLLVTLAGAVLLVGFTGLPEATVVASAPLADGRIDELSTGAVAIAASGVLLLGWAVFRSKLVNPADGVLLMLAAVTMGAGTTMAQPVPTVGALLLLAAGMGLAWTGGRLVPRG